MVKDRMDITGARWGLEGAEAILKLRALTASGDFEDYWHFHQRQEHKHVHGAIYREDLVLAANQLTSKEPHPIYTDTVRRINRQFNMWLYSLQFWRFLLTYFILSLAVTYAIFLAGDWMTSHALHWFKAADGQSTLFYFAFAAWLTVIGVIGRHTMRRRLGLTPPRQRP